MLPTFFVESGRICATIDTARVELFASEWARVRERGGCLFIIDVVGSAGNVSHAVNDFRKLCGIEAQSPVDNVPKCETSPPSSASSTTCRIKWTSYREEFRRQRLISGGAYPMMRRMLI